MRRSVATIQNSKLKTQNSHRHFRSARQRGGRLLLPRPHADTRHRQRAVLPIVVSSCGEVRTARRRQRDIAHRDAEPTLCTDSCRGFVRCHLSRGAQRTCGVEAPPRRAHHQHCRGRHRRLCRPWTQDARVRLQGGRLCLRAGAVRHARKHHRRLLLLVGAAVPHRLLRRRGRHYTHVRGGGPALEGLETAGAHRARTGATHRRKATVHVASARRRSARDERPSLPLFYHREDIQRRLLAAGHDRALGGSYGGRAAADNARHAQGEQPRVAV